MCNAGSDEQKFLEASMAYVAGNPIMSDEEFDDLKIKLKVGAHLFLDCKYLYTNNLYNGLTLCGFSHLSKNKNKNVALVYSAMQLGDSQPPCGT